MDLVDEVLNAVQELTNGVTTEPVRLRSAAPQHLEAAQVALTQAGWQDVLVVNDSAMSIDTFLIGVPGRGRALRWVPGFTAIELEAYRMLRTQTVSPHRARRLVAALKLT